MTGTYDVRMLSLRMVNHAGPSGYDRCAEGLSSLDPQEVLRRRYQRDYEGEPPAALLEAFDELLDLDGQAESA